MNIEKARFNMIEQQIRPWKVLDQQVLDLMATLPREKFVPDAYQGLAFADIAIPLKSGRCMLHPREEGRLLQAVKPKPDENALVINPGTGYMVALLASMAKKVHAVDSDSELAKSTADTLAALNIYNVTVECDEISQGMVSEAPYDVIVVMGSTQVISDPFKQLLKVGGRMFCVVGKEPTMEAMLITRISQDDWQEEELFETLMPALEGSPEVAQFHF